MAVFTCITEVRESFHLTQHLAGGPEAGMRDHLAALPYDDGAGPFGDELEWLRRLSGGIDSVELVTVGHCPGTWMWLGGAHTSLLTVPTSFAPPSAWKPNEPLRM